MLKTRYTNKLHRGSYDQQYKEITGLTTARAILEKLNMAPLYVLYYSKLNRKIFFLRINYIRKILHLFLVFKLFYLFYIYNFIYLAFKLAKLLRAYRSSTYSLISIQSIKVLLQSWQFVDLNLFWIVLVVDFIVDIV